jgi:hypothetical protein
MESLKLDFGWSDDQVEMFRHDNKGWSRHSDDFWFHGVEQAFMPAVSCFKFRLQPLR